MAPLTEDDVITLAVVTVALIVVRVAVVVVVVAVIVVTALVVDGISLLLVINFIQSADEYTDTITTTHICNYAYCNNLLTYDNTRLYLIALIANL